MQFAKLNDTILHFQEIGAPEGKPVLVFINALGTDFRIWRDVIIRFVGEAHVLTYDKRGHGLSNVGDTPYSIEDHAADLAALLDHLGKKNVILVGLSVGGLIAQSLYKTRPDLIAGLILCDTAAKIGTKDSWAERIARVEAVGLDAQADISVKGWFTSSFLQERRDEVMGYRNMVARQPVEGYLATCQAISDADYTADAKVIAAPTMCVVGLDDQTTTPEHVYEMSTLISDSRYEEIKGAGHLPCIEQPEVMANLIKDFLKTMTEKPEGSNVLH